jgi:hypothetical protein
VKAKQHGQDILPMVIALLQIPTLLPTSSVICLECINLCIEADITDPRASMFLYFICRNPLINSKLVWNVLMNKYISGLGQTPISKAKLEALFRFFELVGVKADDSEVYTTFKLDILLNYLVPSIREGNSSLVRSLAYNAMSSYPPEELYPLLGDPRAVVQTLVELHQEPALALLVQLIRHEVRHMRRAVFKGIAAAVGVSQSALKEEVSGKDQFIRLLTDSCVHVKSTWYGGRCPAGIRSGLSVVSLTMSKLLKFQMGLRPFEVDSAVFGRLPISKDLVNALKDMSISDHVLLRIEAVPVWICFWDSKIKEVYHLAVDGEDEEAKVKRVEWLVRNGVSELLEKRLKDSRLPYMSVNILLSLAGISSSVFVCCTY